jgi:hypothetical protein
MFCAAFVLIAAHGCRATRAARLELYSCMMMAMQKAVWLHDWLQLLLLLIAALG